MRKVTVSAKTVDEAIAQALHELQTTKDKVTITILEEPSRGLFGIIGSRPAKIEVEKNIDPIEEGRIFLESIIAKMNVHAVVETFHREDYTIFNLQGKGLGILIGRRGQTLDALQYLVSVVTNRHSKNHLRIILDAENYREKRKQSLEELADRLAHKVAVQKKPIKLEPMSPLERKIIHTYLQEHPEVKTHSEGVEPHRYLVISNKRYS